MIKNYGVTFVKNIPENLMSGPLIIIFLVALFSDFKIEMIVKV
jgi:hypothetical protein